MKKVLLIAITLFFSSQAMGQTVNQCKELQEQVKLLEGEVAQLQQTIRNNQQMMSNNSQRLAQETNVLATSSQKLIHQSQNAMRIMNEQNSFLLFLSDEVQFLRRQNSDLRDAKEDLQGRVADLGSKNTNLEKKNKEMTAKLTPLVACSKVNLEGVYSFSSLVPGAKPQLMQFTKGEDKSFQVSNLDKDRNVEDSKRKAAQYPVATLVELFTGDGRIKTCAIQFYNPEKKDYAVSLIVGVSDDGSLSLGGDFETEQQFVLARLQ